MSRPRVQPGDVPLGALLGEPFYARPGDVVAPELLGKYLVVRHGQPAEPHIARIVETEAYVGEDDLACHASKGLTARTSTIYGPPGHAYVYLIYGMYHMLNVVAERAGVPHAVLVRAVELIDGSHGAGAPDGPARTDGPGKLTRVLGITKAQHNGASLRGPKLAIHDGPAPAEVGVSARVGVAYAGAWADAPLRYFDAHSPDVSKPSPKQVGSGR